MDIQDIMADLARAGLIEDMATARAEPLTGGVSSDIHLVRHSGGALVIKRALAKLRVADDWHADVSRNDFEQKYMRYVSAILPGAVPAILHSNTDLGYFAMEYLEGEWRTWKDVLFRGDFALVDAARAGGMLGAIHQASHGDAVAARDFATDDNFHQLRLESYLLTTGSRHPALRDVFFAEADRLAATHEALVHGDFSPKNILIGKGRMVLLDCEVAWYGDPVFDLAFLLNHFFLKTLHHAPVPKDLGGMVAAFLAAYAQAYRHGHHAALETRLVRLLPMLLLARVDGKSPAEYLTPAHKILIRGFAPEVIVHSPGSMRDLVALWQRTLSIGL